jgi:hypothetical protein
MNCIKHAEAPAAGTCAACAESFCSQCLVTIKGEKYCAECKKSALGKDAIAVNDGPVGVCEEAGSALKYSLIGLIILPFILQPIAIFKALKARKMIAQNPRLEGAGKATAALVIGIAYVSLMILGLIANGMASSHGRH